MNPPDVPSQLWSAHQELEDRCHRIGIPVLTCDPDGTVRSVRWEAGAGPGEATLTSLIASTRFKGALKSALARWNDTPNPDAAEILTGWTVLPLPIVSRRRRTGYLCAVMLAPGANTGEHFQSMCQSAQVDTEAAARLLDPAIGKDPRSTARIIELVRLMLRDRVELSGAEQALEGFSTQLAESYEEIDLLYRIGRSMKEFVSSEGFVRHLCDQIHETMPYRWVAARFLRNVHISQRLTGKTFIFGDAEVLETSEQDHLAEIMAIADKPEVAVLTLQPAGVDVLYRPIERDSEIVGVLVVGEKVGTDTSVSSVDMKLLDGATRLAEVSIVNTALYEEQQKLFLGTLEALISSIDAKDPYTCGHSQRVSELSVALARVLGYEGDELENIRISGLVHDIGKIGVPERVLLKSTRLTDEEFGLIKLHPEIGHRILRDISMIHDALPGVLHHHERWDGRGYPGKLEGEDIPRIARIIGVADAFDAMSSSRTYRAAMERQKVLNEIREGAGTQFDPEIAKAFLTLDLAFYDEMLEQIGTERRPEAA